MFLLYELEFNGILINWLWLINSTIRHIVWSEFSLVAISGQMIDAV